MHMSILDNIRLVTTMVRQYNDIELNQRIVELTQQAVELATENARLLTENKKLQEKADVENRIVRDEQPFFTLDGENNNLRYCSTCWGKNSILIQVQCYDSGKFKCPECGTSGTYDKSKQYRSIFM